MPGNKLPKIIFISHWAAQLGGAEYSLIDIIEHAATVAQTWLFTAEPGELIDIVSRTKCTPVVVPCVPGIGKIRRDHFIRALSENMKSAGAFVRYVYNVNKYMRSISPDCIHANVPKSHIALLLLRLMGYRGRCIVHMREIFPRGSAVMFLYRIMFRLSGGAVIIAISNAVKESLPGRMRRGAHVIHNGVDIGSVRTVFPDCVPIRFLFLGRIVPWKGCDLLVNAYINVLRKAGDGAALLTMVGDTSYWDSSYREHLAGLIKRSAAAASIRLCDKTDDPVAVLHQHDVLCMPSVCEPFGRVAAEAQAACMPVLGFACGGLPEVVVNDETGFLVPPGDTNAFTDAMLSFVACPSLVERMGMRGRSRALELFDKQYQIPKIVDLIIGTCGRTD